MRSPFNNVDGSAPRSTIATLGARLLVLCMASVLALDRSVVRAEYQTLEKKLETAKANVLRLRTVRRVLTDPATYRNEEELKKFDSFFLDYLFPVMTQTSPRALGNVGKGREYLFKQGLWNRRIHADAHRHLTKITFDQMKQIATENFHPVVRYNAVITLGLLDQQPATSSGQPPVALPDAADVLLELIRPDAKNVPDAVKIGALLGLIRHVPLGLSADRAERLSTAALALMSKERPDDQTIEGHAWLQTLCVEALAQLGQLGEDSQVHKAILALIRNSDRPVSNRCREVAALAKLKSQYTPAAGIDAEATIAALATLVKDVTEMESEEAADFKENELSGRSRNSNYGEEVEYPRRRLLYRVQSLLDGLDAVDAVLSGEAKPHVQEIRDGLTKIKEIASDKDSLDLSLSDETSEMIAPKIIAAAEALLPKETEDEADALDEL